MNLLREQLCLKGFHIKGKIPGKLWARFSPELKNKAILTYCTHCGAIIANYNGESKKAWFNINAGLVFVSLDTPSKVYSLLHHFMRLKIYNGFYSGRLAIYYGDTATGEPWGDIDYGYVGLSTGWMPIFILANRADSCGGGAILTDSIVKMICYSNKKHGNIIYELPCGGTQGEGGK